MLRDPVIGPLAVTQLISALGSAMVGLAFVFLSYDRSGSVFRAVLVTAAYTMPAAIFGVAAGRLAQHRSRRRILVVAYALKIVLYGALAVVEVSIGLSKRALGGQLRDRCCLVIVQTDAPEDLEGALFAVDRVVYTTIGPLAALVLARASHYVDVYALLAMCGALLLVCGLPVRRGPAHDADGHVHPALLLHRVIHRRGVFTRGPTKAGHPQ